MLLDAKRLIERKKQELKEQRKKITFRPTLELIWVGADPLTRQFIAAKQRMAKELEVDFALAWFDSLGERQLEAVIQQANVNEKVQGLVLQLPLPPKIRTDRMIALIDRDKDVDSLRGLDLPAPTARGIVELLDEHRCINHDTRVAVLGIGRLVGGPLIGLLDQRKIPYLAVKSQAASRAEEIKRCQILVACTGVRGLVTENMIDSEMIVVDGSGVDVEQDLIEPRVRMITPKKGAIGPLTVLNLFSNFFTLIQRGRADK